MEHDVARKLLALVNNKQNVDRLTAYAEYRIDFLHTQLEQCQSVDEIRVLQGQLKEARRLLTLRDEAVQRAEDGKQ